MSQNEAFAAAAHLHVLLRRKTGRVTDTEWMVSNAEYALAVVRFAREKASSEGMDDLLPLADRLELLVTPPISVPARGETKTPPTTTVHQGPMSPQTNDLRTRYIGRLR